MLEANMDTEVRASLRSYLDRGRLRDPRATLQLLAELASSVADLHAAGLIHRHISADSISLDSQSHVRLDPPNPTPLIDEDPIPPEMPQLTGVSIPAEIDDARQVLAGLGIDMDPRRIDAYQVAELAIQLWTKQSVRHYQRSPLARADVPVECRDVLDGMLGFVAGHREAECERLAAVCRELLNSRTVERRAVECGEPDGQESRTPADNRVRRASDSDQPDSQGESAFAGSDDTLPARLAHYRIDRRIGGGGMGDVYAGYDESLERTVAIKVLPSTLARHKDFVQRFHHEASAAANVAHPNVVPIYFIGEDQGRHFFAMQFIEGQSLAQLLESSPQVPADRALEIVEGCLTGLQAAHQQGLIHRDIKPGNILIDRETGRIVLVDFGLVQRIDRQTRLTSTGIIMGSVDYIAPEQARGQPVDFRADLYSLGVLLYQMLAGRLPFNAETPTAMIFQHAYEQPRALRDWAPHVPRPLAAIVARLMAKPPEHRYESCQQVLSDLARFRAGEPLDAATVGQAQAPTLRGVSDLEFQPAHDLHDDIETLAPPLDPGPKRLLLRVYALVLRWLFLPVRAAGSDGRPQETEQYLDAMLARYAQQRNELSRLLHESESAGAQLRSQARVNREAARRDAEQAGTADDDECLRTAADLDRRATEQEQQSADARRDLQEIESKLHAYRAQRDALRARLQLATAATPPTRVSSLSPTRLVVLLILPFVLIGIGWLASSWFWPTANRRPPATVNKARQQPARSQTDTGPADTGPAHTTVAAPPAAPTETSLTSPDGVAAAANQYRPPSAVATFQDVMLPFKLPFAYRSVAVGGTGRYFLFTLGNSVKGQTAIAVFDVLNATIVHTITDVSDDVLVAAGREKMLLVLPGQRVIQRYSLDPTSGFRRERIAALPDGMQVGRILMGCNSDGPLMLTGPTSLLFDIDKMEEMSIDGKIIGGASRYGYRVDVAANGKTFAGITTGITGQPYQRMQIKGNSTTIANFSSTSHAIRFAKMTADGSLIFRDGTEVFDAELQPVAASWLGKLFPTVDPRYFLSVRFEKHDKGLEEVRIDICTTADRRIVHSVRGFAELAPRGNTNGRRGYEDRLHTGVDCYHYLPWAKLIVTLAPDNQTIYVRRIDLIAALEKSGENYLFVDSIPPHTASRGRRLQYDVQVQSKYPETTLQLAQSPPTMSINSKGVLHWNVPADFNDESAHVILIVRNSEGAEIFHTFDLAIRPN